MTTETIVTADYHRPDIAVKLEILRNRFGYTRAQAAHLSGKNLTLAVVRGGELRVLEGRLDVHFGGRADFFPKGHRTAEVFLEAWEIIGHVAGYGHAPEIARNALAEFERISAGDVRTFLAAREMTVREDAARDAATAIAKIRRDLVTAQEEWRAADAKILALLNAPNNTLTLAA